MSLFLSMSREEQRSALEAVIFAADEPLSDKALYKLLVLDDAKPETETAEAVSGEEAGTEVAEAAEEKRDDTQAGEAEELSLPKRSLSAEDTFSIKDFRFLVDEINHELQQTNRPYRIVKIAGGYQFGTTSEHGEYIQRLIKAKSRRRLSQAALETLAIIAYRQPVTKPEIEAVRGVSSNEVVNSLIEKNLVQIAGRAETLGKPLLYSTTDDFLRIFGLNSTNDLPKLRELEEIIAEHRNINAEDIELEPKQSISELRKRMSALMQKKDDGELPGEGESVPDTALEMMEKIAEIVEIAVEEKPGDSAE